MENQEPLSPLPNTVTAKDPKSSKRQAIILIVSGLILITATAPFLYQKYFAAETTENLSTNSQGTTTTSTSSEQAKEFADWQTYRNEEYGFEFKYPKQESFREHNPSQEFIQIFTDSVRIKATKNRYIDESSDWFLDTPPNGEFILGNITWKTFFLPNGYCDGPGCSVPIYAVNTRRENVVYSVTFGEKQQISDLQKQILSTFKFTK